ncbi:hypothetical protein Tco_1541846 [Tanacetum coccineum]
MNSRSRSLANDSFKKLSASREATRALLKCEGVPPPYNSIRELDSHESSLLSQDKPHPSHHRLLLSGVICGISGDMNSETHGYIDTPHMSLTSGVESIGCAIEHLSKDVERSQDDFYVWGLYGNVIGDWINKGIVGWVGREVVWYKSTIADMVASKSEIVNSSDESGLMQND